MIIGIDPGKKGGCVLLDRDANPIDWLAADHADDGYCKSGVYFPRLMAAWVAGEGGREPVRLVVIEKQQARPIEGRSSCLATGRGQGLWEGICAASGCPYLLVSPGKWTRTILGSMPKGTDRKARAIAMALERLPDLPLTWGRRRKPHDGLADAACLALFGLKQFSTAAA